MIHQLEKTHRRRDVSTKEDIDASFEIPGQESFNLTKVLNCLYLCLFMLSAFTNVLNIELHLSYNEHLLYGVVNAPLTTTPVKMIYTRNTLFHHSHFLYDSPRVAFLIQILEQTSHLSGSIL